MNRKSSTRRTTVSAAHPPVPRRRPTARRRAGVLTAAVTGLLLLGTACSAESGDLSGASAAKADGSGTKLVVSETAGTPSAFLSYGVEKGFFTKEGLDLEVRASSGGASIIPALLSGDIDVAGSNAVSAMIAIDKRMPVRMIAAGTSTAERADDDFASIMVGKDSRIKKAEDLQGARIAVNTLQNINDVAIHSVLSRHGLALKDVKFVEMPLPDMPAAISRGDVDAGLLIEPFVTIGRSQGLRDVARPYTETRPGLQIGTFLMKSEAIEKNPERALAFRRAVVATAESIRQDPQAFRDALPSLSKLTPALAAKMDLPVWRGTTNRESIETMHDVMRTIRLTDAELDYDKAVMK